MPFYAVACNIAFQPNGSRTTQDCLNLVVHHADSASDARDMARGHMLAEIRQKHGSFFVNSESCLSKEISVYQVT